MGPKSYVGQNFTWFITSKGVLNYGRLLGLKIICRFQDILKRVETCLKIRHAADLAATWSSNMNMQLNAKKTELVVDFNNPKHDLPPITINGETIE